MKKLTRRQLHNQQPSFAKLDDQHHEFARAMIPKNVVVIETQAKTIDQIVEEMMHVPLDKHALLDFCIGRERGDAFPTEDHADLYRLQMLLNSEWHGKRFDWLGNDMIVQMVRRSIVEELWKPFRRKGDNG